MEQKEYVNIYINVLLGNKMISGRKHYNSEEEAKKSQCIPENGYIWFGACEVRAKKDGEK